jgi:hypothetical protein
LDECGQLRIVADKLEQAANVNEFELVSHVNAKEQLLKGLAMSLPVDGSERANVEQGSHRVVRGYRQRPLRKLISKEGLRS